jgi:hypothetical protein
MRQLQHRVTGEEVGLSAKYVCEVVANVHILGMIGAMLEGVVLSDTCHEVEFGVRGNWLKRKIEHRNWDFLNWL